MRDISRRTMLAALALLCAAVPLGPILADGTSSQAPGIRIALKGYDPVSYFTEGNPEKGSPAFTAEFDGAVYWFRDTAHRDRFAADPDKYAPQYGGFCAISLAHGVKAEPDPEAWVISEGKLYVFRSKEGVPMFEKQTAGIVAEAAENWRGLRTPH